MTRHSIFASDPEDRAVSPVVGVAILVGITVILASVVGAFVFGLVSIGESSPDASFTFSQKTSAFDTDNQDGGGTDINDADLNMKTVRVTHNSGEAIQLNQLVPKVSGNKSDPQSNESVYEIDYNGDEDVDDYHLVLNKTSGSNSVFKPGNSFTIGFYGISKTRLDDGDLVDYNVTNSNPPTDDIGVSGLGGTDAARGAKKIGECDLVEVVWRSDSGAQGQVLQSYQVPGTECA
jgi:flagellin-like protein